MRIRALAMRILIQIRHDKRTLGLILIAPLFIMTIVYFIFNGANTELHVGVINVDDEYVYEMESNDEFDVTINEYECNEEGEKALKDEKVIAVLDMTEDNPVILLDGSEATNVKQALTVINSARLNINLDKLPMNIKMDEWETKYVLGKEDSSMFDTFGAGMLGIIIFFLVFLIGGINFLGERTSGTLEKLLSTPIRRIEIVLGYILGFGILAILQSLIFTLFVVHVLNLEVMGSIYLVILITLLTAITALTLGMMLSTLANSEFQMVQFIPIVILPQIFLCGIFKLSGGWDIAGHFMPLYYTTEALNEVILKGRTISYIADDILVLLVLSGIFITINTLLLKFKRSL
ncbi:MAG TPA: ABC transporter permease [Anaerovoracaceae bacterium]|nr:ABC transporter permease [Anaerovoracaceae bacterium]